MKKINKGWERTLITKSSTIKQALNVINTEEFRVALVVNENNKLIGTITDGDIRRGLLSDLLLTDQVLKVMNDTPISALLNTPQDELQDIMRRNQIHSIPLLSNEGNVVGLELYEKHKQNDIYENPVFIMAGGFGTRLLPLTDDCPKPMLSVGDKPMLETMILRFIKSGFRNFYISTHYMPEVIQKYFGDGSKLGVEITYIHEEQPLGTAGSLGLLPKNLPEDLPLIMINGDVLTKLNFMRMLDFHNDNNADATMCVREYDYQIPYGVININGNKIVDIVEKPIQRFLVNAGIYILSKKVINKVKKDEILDMPTLLKREINESNKVVTFPLHEYWLDIGSIDDFNKAQLDILSISI